MARARALDAETEIEGTEAAEAGFTLIELMVVLLIIAILLAIAIPTFLGVSNTASDRAAQSNLSNALTESTTLYQVNAAYSGPSVPFTTGSFTSQAPEFNWVGVTTQARCGTGVTNCVSAYVFSVATTGDAQGLSLAVDSTKTNSCWFAFDLQSTPGTPVTGAGSVIPTAGVFYGKSTSIPAGGCEAIDPTSSAVTLTGGQSYSTAVTLTAP
jgi:type IV pilus assembly protein PilA